MKELLEFLASHGHADFEPILDGTWHRINEYTTFAGTLYENPHYICASINDHKEGEIHRFTSKSNYSKEENEINAKRLEETRRVNEAQQKEAEIQAAKIAEEKWKRAGQDSSPYLVKKAVGDNPPGTYGLRTAPNSWGAIDLIVPYRDIQGKLWGYQKIQEDGKKFFQPGARLEGCFFSIGEITSQTEKIFIAEGIATALSIHLATKAVTICAFNAGKLESVAKEIRNKWPMLPIIIGGDDDYLTMVNGTHKNVGKLAAEKAAASVNGIAVFPVFDDNMKRGTDFNDLHCIEGLKAVEKQLAGISPHNPKEIIPTQGAGFHKVTVSPTGKITYTPEYDDLRKFFERTYVYKVLAGACWIWTGKKYKEYPKEYVEGFAQKHFVPIANNKKCDEFRGLVSRTNFIESNWFDDTTENKINFNNGILDIKTNTFTKHSHEYGFRYVLNYDYNPNAKCPEFEKYLKGVSCGDDAIAANLLEFMGYVLSNDRCWLEKALILEGEGSNGKSTFMRLLRELVGAENCSAYSLSDLRSESYRHGLNGKLFNMTEETPTRALVESSIFKYLSDGGVMSARSLYKNPYTLRNKTKLIMACNEMPTTEDTTYGLTRKVHIIPFRAFFDDKLKNKDSRIEDKLKLELSGIFNLAIEAYKQCLLRGKLTESKASMDAMNEYKREIDYTLDWIENALTFHPLGNGMDERKQSIPKVYSSYKMEMENTGFKPLNKFKFGKKLSKAIPDYKERAKQIKIQNKVERYLLATTKDTGENF